ncbi:MAG: V-type ATP synthase subunit F [Alkalispirochaeta sp.]
MKYYVIGDQDTVLGFAMVGVEGRTVSTAEQAGDAFQHALKQDDVGIIIITEATADLIRSVVDQYTFTADFPLIVEIPDRRGTLPDRPDLRTLVNQAIGINL